MIIFNRAERIIQGVSLYSRADVSRRVRKRQVIGMDRLNPLKVKFTIMERETKPHAISPRARGHPRCCCLQQEGGFQLKGKPKSFGVIFTGAGGYHGCQREWVKFSAWDFEERGKSLMELKGIIWRGAPIPQQGFVE